MSSPVSSPVCPPVSAGASAPPVSGSSGSGASGSALTSSWAKKSAPVFSTVTKVTRAAVTSAPGPAVTAAGLTKL